MTRTGTLAFSRIALLATLVGWAGVAQAQSSAQSSRADARLGSPAHRTHEPIVSAAPIRRPTTWKPTRIRRRCRSRNSTTCSARTAPPKNWLTPNAGSRPQDSSRQPKSSNRTTPQTGCAAGPETVRAAGRRRATRRPRRSDRRERRQRSVGSDRQPQTLRNRATPESPRRPRRRNQPHAESKPASRLRGARNHARSRRPSSASRPRPIASRLFDDSWIRPLKQVAYQAGEPEELYAPPGDSASRQRCRCQSGPMMDEPMQGEPMMGPRCNRTASGSARPDGGLCCDGGCGPIANAARVCGDGVGCCVDLCERDDDARSLHCRSARRRVVRHGPHSRARSSRK